VTTDELARVMVEMLRGGFGTCQLSYRRPKPGKGEPVWVLEARGERLPPGHGVWSDGPSLDKVLPKPPTAR
jgi:hypothetical protein